MSYYSSVPTSALVTGCLPGCTSRVEWEYDDGEPMTRDYPGSPAEVFPYAGCDEAHLERLMDETDHESEVWALWNQWQILEHGASAFKQRSRVHLGLRPYRSLLDIVGRSYDDPEDA